MSVVTNTMNIVVLIRAISSSVNLIVIIIIIIIIIIIFIMYYCSIVMVLIVFSSYEDCSYEFVEFHFVLCVSYLIFV